MSTYTDGLTVEQLEIYRDQCMSLASKAESRKAMKKAEQMMREAEMYDAVLTARIS